MKMVILGAGASFDSIIPAKDSHNLYRQKWQPPLGKDIFGFNKEFDDILNKYSGAASFRSEISICQDIEDLFQKKYELSHGQNGGNLFLQLINVQFYLQDLFINISREYVNFGISNYDILVSQAYEYFLKTGENVLFVTFNYDTLLEKSIEKICNIKFDTINDYIKYPLIVIKPHGSCNWFKKVNILDDLGQVIINNITLSNYINDPIHIDTTLRIIDGLNNQSSEFYVYDKLMSELASDKNFRKIVFPQILIPLRSKDEFVLPDSHLKLLESSLEKVNDILIIGWKANETYFHNLLQEKIRSEIVKVMLVCHSDSTIISRLNDITKYINFTTFIETFLLDEEPLGPGTFSSYIHCNSQTSRYNFFEV